MQVLYILKQAEDATAVPYQGEFLPNQSPAPARSSCSSSKMYQREKGSDGKGTDTADAPTIRALFLSSLLSASSRHRKNTILLSLSSASLAPRNLCFVLPPYRTATHRTVFAGYVSVISMPRRGVARKCLPVSPPMPSLHKVHAGEEATHSLLTRAYRSAEKTSHVSSRISEMGWNRDDEKRDGLPTV